jgi:signal transduction histidine kinase
MNLVSNANKFTRDGSIKILIDFENDDSQKKETENSERQKQYFSHLMVIVADQGIGMNKED